MHSPFVYDFIVSVLNRKDDGQHRERIEALRKALLHNEAVLQVQDLGAGSRTQGKAQQRKVKQVAARALKPKKYAALLQRIANRYKCRQVAELGTSLGITTAYLATAERVQAVHSFEGVEDIAAVAARNFQQLGITNVKLHTGNFDHTFPDFLEHCEPIDLLYIDGNHRLEPTLRYFKQALPKLHAGSIVAFDDIHWSAEMEQAWQEVKQQEVVTLSIDLFFIGLVFLSKDFKVKQDFVVRF